jgi:hypothetical protein
MYVDANNCFYLVMINKDWKAYRFIFQQNYSFLDVASQMEAIVQRMKEFLFIMYPKGMVNAVIVCDEKYKDLFANLPITLEEITLDNAVYEQYIYAVLRRRLHYAIPFSQQPESFPMYKIMADVSYAWNDTTTTTVSIPLVFIMHCLQHSERYSIASYLRKHEIEKKKDSIYYAYGDAIKLKSQMTHFYCTLLVGSRSKELLQKGLTAFKQQYFSYAVRSNNYPKLISSRLEKLRFYNAVIRRPRKPLLFGKNAYPVLSQVEVVSLMLPDSLMLRLTIDGVRPYSTGEML